MLAFTSVYFLGSWDIKGLRPFGVKKFGLLIFRLYSSRFDLHRQPNHPFDPTRRSNKRRSGEQGQCSTSSYFHKEIADSQSDACWSGYFRCNSNVLAELDPAIHAVQRVAAARAILQG
jgi:hypothetical protein